MSGIDPKKFVNSYSNNGKSTLDNIKNLRKNGIKEGGRELSQLAAQKTVEAGLTAAGVPLPIAKLLGKVGGKFLLKGIKFYLFVAVSSFLVLILAIVSIFANFAPVAGEDIKETSYAREIPEPYLNIFKEYGIVTGIPWTIYAALSKTQTDHGRISPYDTIIRDDKDFVKIGISEGKIQYATGNYASNKDLSEYYAKSSYPTALGRYSEIEGTVYKCLNNKCGPDPVIGGEEDQGKGIFLLLPNSTKSKTKDFNDINTSMEILTDLILKSEDSYAKKNKLSFEKSKNAIYWQSVLKDIEPYMANPKNKSSDCSSIDLPDDMYNRIIDIWKCEYTKHNVKIYYSNNSDSGELKFNQLSSESALNQLLAQALAVSYNYSGWSKIKCNPFSSTTGIFPITKEQDKRYNISRCNDAQNIAVAAKIVMSDLETPVEERISVLGKYQPEFYGWDKINGALGNSKNLEKLYIYGPYSVNKISNICKNYTLTYFTNNINKANLEKQFPTFNNLFSDPNKLSPRNTSDCLMTGNKKLNEYQYATLVSNILTLLYSKNGEDISLSSDDIKNLEYLIKIVNDSLSKFKNPTFGVDSSVSQLSLTGQTVDFPVDSSQLIGFSGDFLTNILSLAQQYGGISSDPIDYSASLISLSYLRDYTLNKKIPVNGWSSDFKKVPFSNCSNIYIELPNERVSREELTLPYESLCRDAKLAGVNLMLTSAYRSNEHQVYLYNNAVDKRFVAPPAKRASGKWNGGSPHERGLAVDVGKLTSPEQIKAIHFLHDIVGCYNTLSKEFKPFPSALDYIEYANGETEKCTQDVNDKVIIPIKRVNTYGLVFWCANDDTINWSLQENLNDPNVIRCSDTDTKTTREYWHLQIGKPEQISINLEKKKNSDIRNYFPIEKWNEAKIVTEKASGNNPNFILPSTSKNKYDLIGLFALPLNIETLDIYNTLYENKITTDFLKDKLLDPSINSEIAYQYWLKCDFGFFYGAKNLGYSSKCDNSDIDNRRNMILISDSRINSNLSEMLLSIFDEYEQGGITSINKFASKEISKYFLKDDYIDYSLKDYLTNLKKVDEIELQSGDIILLSANKTTLNYLALLIDPASKLSIFFDPDKGPIITKVTKKFKSQSYQYYRRI